MATVGGGEGRGSGRRERGFASVYKSLSLLPVAVRPFKPAFIVPQEGKRAGGWAEVPALICGLVFFITLNVNFYTVYYLRVFFWALKCAWLGGCGWWWVWVRVDGWRWQGLSIYTLISQKVV